MFEMSFSECLEVRTKGYLSAAQQYRHLSWANLCVVYSAGMCPAKADLEAWSNCHHLSRGALGLQLSAPHSLLGVKDGARLGVALGRAQRDLAHARAEAQRADGLSMAALLQMSSPWKSEPCLCSSALPPSKTQQ